MRAAAEKEAAEKAAAEKRAAEKKRAEDAAAARKARGMAPKCSVEPPRSQKSAGDYWLLPGARTTILATPRPRINSFKAFNSLPNKAASAD